MCQVENNIDCLNMPTCIYKQQTFDQLSEKYIYGNIIEKDPLFSIYFILIFFLLYILIC